MSGENFIVPPLGWQTIAGKVARLRSNFGLADKADFPVMDFIERVLDQKLGLLRLIVLSKEEMGQAEGYADPAGKFIVLRDDVYDGAISGNGRDRYTAAHELGHWNMHVNIPLARAPSNTTAKAYELSEPQANRFAAELLMPPQFFQSNDTVAMVMMRHGVSYQAAEYRLDEMRKKGKI